MQANNQGLEVIYVSLDRNRASFDEYYGTMPWYTIPYEDDARVSRTDSAISNWTTNSWLLGKISFEELTCLIDLFWYRVRYPFSWEIFVEKLLFWEK